VQLADQSADLRVDISSCDPELAVLIHANHGAARGLARSDIDDSIEFHIGQLRLS
jgi:hypothetical protein